MISTLTFPNKQSAVLEDDGRWTSTDTRLAGVLNTLFSPLNAEEQVSRALPSWGRAEAIKAAEFYKASIAWPEREAADDEVVY